MSRTLLILTLFICTVSVSAQPFRYASTVFHKVDTLKNVEYATADWLNNPIALFAPNSIHDGESNTINRSLFMDLFMPKNDTLTLRPTIVFAHGGAFLKGTRHNDDMVAFCDSFARRGYVTATIDYRIGVGASVSRFAGIMVGLKMDENNVYRAVYRAVQDSRAAIRFLKSNALQYGIDTTKIYLAGSSAGAIVALQNLYLDKNREVSPAAFLKPNLGNLDTIGIAGFGARANATAALWGAIQLPGLIESDSTAVFLAHGTADQIVPFKKGKPLQGIIPENPFVTMEMPETYGSFCVDTALANRNTQHKTYFVEGKTHEFYGVDTGEFGETGPNSYWDSVNFKIADFFLEQFAPDADFDFETDDLAVRFTNTSTNVYNSNWDFGNGNSETGNQPGHLYAKAGIYRVKLTTCTANAACDTLTKTLTVGPNVASKTMEMQQFKIFPNPVSGRIHIKGISGNYNLSVFNLVGQRLICLENIALKSLDVAHLKKGVYLLEIEQEGKSARRKFLKTH